MASGVEQFNGRTGERIDVQTWNVRRSFQRIQANNPFDRTKLENILLRQVGAVHRNQERKLFASEGASGGSQWTALSLRYRLEKEKAVGRKKILVRTGEMRKQFTQAGDPAHIQRLFGTSPIRMEFGARSRKGYVHTFEGVVRGVGGAVRRVIRSVIQKTPAQTAEMVAEVEDYFRKRYTNIILEGFGLKPRPVSDRVKAELAGIE